MRAESEPREWLGKDPSQKRGSFLRHIGRREQYGWGAVNEGEGCRWPKRDQRGSQGKKCSTAFRSHSSVKLHNFPFDGFSELT